MARCTAAVMSRSSLLPYSGLPISQQPKPMRETVGPASPSFWYCTCRSPALTVCLRREPVGGALRGRAVSSLPGTTTWRVDMTTVGLYVRLQARPGREADLANFLRSALPLVEAEPATTAWFAIQMGPSTF